MLKIINIVGARPNFMKITPIMQEMRKFPGQINPILVHTEQHYDENMSKLFFRDLELPQPDIYLGVGSGTHAEQTAKIMIEFEKVLTKEQPDLVVVVGDVNSTIACALTAVKLHIPVAHVEAGLRSFDRNMPEEINRILTDAISDYLFTTEPDAEINLFAEGKKKEQIFFVGNVMIDTLLRNKTKADASTVLAGLKLKPREYALLTLHRPENVDNQAKLTNILTAIEEVARHIRVAFPIHPRTRKNLAIDSSILKNPNIISTEPLGYLDFLKLTSDAKLVLTDSGGIQEETTILGVPCLTLRNNTERPVTVTQGTNRVVGTNAQKIIEEVKKTLNETRIEGKIPKYWDGKAAQRIVQTFIR